MPQMNCGCPRCPVDTGRLEVDSPTGNFGGLTVENVIRHAREQVKNCGNPHGVLSDNGILQSAFLSGATIACETAERRHGGAIIRVCGRHGRELCNPCGRDFSELNAESRSRARAEADANAAHRGLGFQPRQLLVWSQAGRPKRYLTELAPGTRVTCINRSGVQMPTLKGEIMCTVVDSHFDGHAFDEEMHPHYRMRYTAGADEPYGKVLCDDVHDPEQWIVEQISVEDMMGGLPAGPSRAHTGTGSGAMPADDIDAASLPSSVPTATIPTQRTAHGNKRFAQRKITELDFQAAVKAHLNMHQEQRQELIPGLPNAKGPTVLLVHNDMVFCTDPELKVQISHWHMQKQGDEAKIHHLQQRPELNGRIGKLLAYSDGRWGVHLGDEKVRVRLRNLKPVVSRTDIIELKSLQERMDFASNPELTDAPWRGHLDLLEDASYPELYSPPGKLTDEEQQELNAILLEAEDDEEREDYRAGFIEARESDREEDRQTLAANLDECGIPCRYAIDTPEGFQPFGRQKPMRHFSPSDLDAIYVVTTGLFGKIW